MNKFLPLSLSSLKNEEDEVVSPLLSLSLSMKNEDCSAGSWMMMCNLCEVCNLTFSHQVLYALFFSVYLKSFFDGAFVSPQITHLLPFFWL